MVDQGTGSTFSALADRGLVSVQWHRDQRARPGRAAPAHVDRGAAAQRAPGPGGKAYKAPPAGTLKEWHWRALAKAYAAGDEGLEGEYGAYARIGERTWQRLLEYKRGALVEERGTGEISGLSPGSPHAHHGQRPGAVLRPVVALSRALSRRRGP